MIDGLPITKSQTVVPLSLNLPLTKSYSLETEELVSDDMVVILENKQQSVFQDLRENPSYTFHATSGLISNRFFLHFILPDTKDIEGMATFGKLAIDSLVKEDVLVYSLNDGVIHLNLNKPCQSPFKLDVMDATGRLVKSIMITEQMSAFNLNESAGMYFIQFEKDGAMFRKKITINL